MKRGRVAALFYQAVTLSEISLHFNVMVSCDQLCSNNG